MAQSRTRWELFLIGIGVVFYLFEFPHGIHGDATVRYDALLSFLRTGRLAPMVYSYVHPLVSSPLLLLGNLYKDGFFWICRFNTFVFLAAAYAAYRAAKGWTGWNEPKARLLVLLLFAATMFPKHVTDYYAEVFSACLILAAILLFQAHRGGLAVLAVSLSVWNTAATMIGGMLLLASFAFQRRRWRYLAAISLLPLGFLAENWLKYGELYPAAYIGIRGPAHPFLPYAEGPGFPVPLFFGLLNVLFSFGRGLLWFAPGLVFLFHPAALRGEGKDRELLRASLLYLAGITFVYAKYWAWHAGAFWGPRYFLFASILAAYLLASRAEGLSPRWRLAWLACVLASCWVGCQGVLFGTDFLEDCFSRGHELEYTCYYVPEYSVLWRIFHVAPPITGRRVAYLLYFLLVAGTVLWVPAGVLVAQAREWARNSWSRFGPGAGWRA